jgi:prophage DNA circulation protein
MGIKIKNTIKIMKKRKISPLNRNKSFPVFNSNTEKSLADIKNWIQTNCDDMSENDLEEINAEIQEVEDVFKDLKNKLVNVKNDVKQYFDQVLDIFNSKKISLMAVKEEFQRTQRNMEIVEIIEQEINKCLGE